MEIAQLEMHYHLRDGSHAMDAVVRNKSEAEALAAFLYVAQQLGVSVQLESAAYGEGGLREVWQFIGQSKDQLGWILAIIVLLFSRYPVSDPEMDALNKQLLRITIEEKKANLEKLKKELKSGEATAATAERAAGLLEGDLRIATRRSNFYRNLINYDKVTGVGFTALDPSARPDESTVPRADFIKFIQTSNNLPVEPIEDARIEIVAPVLKEGDYKWKGVYDGQAISFKMGDEVFKSSVLQGDVSFQHGSTIECVLNVHRKFDEVGEVVITGYTVATVVSKIDGGSVHETIQGKRHKLSKQRAADQRSLFGGTAG